MKRLLSALLLLIAPAFATAAEPPDIGAAAPAFNLPDQAGKTHALSDYAGRWLVLYFYPKDDTPGCTTGRATFATTSYASAGWARRWSA
jgi:peroxiredoxin Q/BCP